MGFDSNTLGWLKRLGSIALACSCLFLVSTQRASAQVDEGSITGTVTDTTGAAVPNASVTLLNTDQGLTLKGTTDGRGSYTFAPVRIGKYSISVTAPGFEKTTQQNVTVNVSQNLTVDIQLKLGAATETVEVTTAPPLLQTADASVGQVVTEQIRQRSPAERPQLYVPRAARCWYAGHPKRIHAATRRLAPLPRTVCVQRRTITCWTVSTTTRTLSTS